MIVKVSHNTVISSEQVLLYVLASEIRNLYSFLFVVNMHIQQKCKGRYVINGLYEDETTIEFYNNIEKKDSNMIHKSNYVTTKAELNRKIILHVEHTLVNDFESMITNGP